jgi:hypothetical protein
MFMAKPFKSMSIPELCSVEISNLSQPEIMAYHHELVVRKGQQEEKLIQLGVNPNTLGFPNTRYDLKQNVALLNMLDNTLDNIMGQP